jgi:hypothetical protein
MSSIIWLEFQLFSKCFILDTVYPHHKEHTFIFNFEYFGVDYLIIMVVKVSLLLVSFLYHYY